MIGFFEAQEQQTMTSRKGMEALSNRRFMYHLPRHRCRALVAYWIRPRWPAVVNAAGRPLTMMKQP